MAAKVAATVWERTCVSDRLEVRKTYKLLVNGSFPRSESGRSYAVVAHDGRFLANVAQGSRKDLRDAVVAARRAQGAWWAMSAYNRGQVLYRWAEMAQSRHSELTDAVVAAEGLKKSLARASVDRAIDTMVWYAGWSDKVAQVLGGANPVAGPFFNFSLPVPSGVIGVIAPQDSSLEGFVETVCAPLSCGNAVVVVVSEGRPIPALVVAEMTATSDVPAGVVNVVSGRTSELGGVLATHEDVDGLDLAGAGEYEIPWAVFAAQSIKRVHRSGDGEGVARLRSFSDIQTVWHTIGQ